MLAQREVIKIDIANDPVNSGVSFIWIFWYVSNHTYIFGPRITSLIMIHVRFNRKKPNGAPWWVTGKTSVSRWWPPTSWSWSSSNGGACSRVSRALYRRWNTRKLNFGKFIDFLWLFAARTPNFHVVPSPGVLLDRPLAWHDHGGYSAAGGRDERRTWQGTVTYST